MDNIWVLTEEERFHVAQKEGVRTEAEYAAWLDRKRDEYLKALQERMRQNSSPKAKNYLKHNWNRLTLKCNDCGISYVDFRAKLEGVPCRG